MNNKLSKELEDIIKDAAYRFGTESDDPEVIEKEAVEFGFKAALTKEVLAQVPEVMKLLDTLEAVIDNTGMTYEQADFANKAIVLGALKPWTEFINKEQE